MGVDMFAGTDRLRRFADRPTEFPDRIALLDVANGELVAVGNIVAQRNLGPVQLDLFTSFERAQGNSDIIVLLDPDGGRQSLFGSILCEYIH